MNRGALVLVALALVGATSITGVGSVSSVSADRGVSVAVAPDGEAYLGIEFGPADGGTRGLTVSNHVSTREIGVTVDGDGFEETADAGPGDPAEFAVPCGSTVEITGVGAGVRIEATRTVGDCPPSGPEGDGADEPGIEVDDVEDEDDDRDDEDGDEADREDDDSEDGTEDGESNDAEGDDSGDSDGGDDSDDSGDFDD